MKSLATTLIIILGVFTLFVTLTGCENPVQAAQVLAEKGVEGVTDELDITVENGEIILNVDETGSISIDSTNITLVSGGVLAEGVAIALEYNDGNPISGTVSIDAETGNIVFTPSSALDAGILYVLKVTAGGVTYSATVLVAIEDTQKDPGLFADVAMLTSGDHAISTLLVSGKAIAGWEFGDNPFQIYIQVTNLEVNAEVLLTCYGTYNIAGHQNEVYYQRWSGSGDLVENFSWKAADSATSTFTIGVDEADSTLDGPNGDPDYSFYDTYFEITIMKDGVNITSTSQAIFKLWY